MKVIERVLAIGGFVGETIYQTHSDGRGGGLILPSGSGSGIGHGSYGWNYQYLHWIASCSCLQVVGLPRVPKVAGENVINDRGGEREEGTVCKNATGTSYGRSVSTRL